MHFCGSPGRPEISMTLINIRALGVTLATPLFSRLDLTIQRGDRLGIVAANGRGKSTLLQTIAGSFEATEGVITRSRGLTTGLATQHVPDALSGMRFYDAVLDALPAADADAGGWRVDMLLEGLGVPMELRERRLSELSGGWQRLVLLARTWITEPDILLLDEPTNHLDLEKIALLENWLASLPAETAVVIASHDRAFLDATTRRTLFLRPERSQLFALPWTMARAALGDMDAADEKRFQRDMKTAQQLRQQAAKLNNIGINSGSDLLTVKTKQLRERARKLEDAAHPAHRERSSGAIALESRSTHAKVLVTLDNASVTTPDGTLLFRTGKRFICQGDRIALLGRNGAGKSSFMTMLRAATGNGRQHGDIRVTPSLVTGYSDQGLEELENDGTPLSVITRRFDISEQQARTLLAGAGIDVAMQRRPIGNLSGGQKARLGMLVLRLGKPAFYLLDEPTNHLDIEGQEDLETELTKAEAGCVLVSHDRSFIRAVANRFWIVDRKGLVETASPDDFFASFG